LYDLSFLGGWDTLSATQVKRGLPSISISFLFALLFKHPGKRTKFIVGQSKGIKLQLVQEE
jgi:hypothetical protein